MEKEKMECKNLKIALYADNVLSEQENKDIENHLEKCPICRYHLSQIQRLKQNLKNIHLPKPPGSLVQSVKNAVLTEIRRKQSLEASQKKIQTWLQFRFMPYFVGVASSLIFFSALWISLFSINKSEYKENLSYLSKEQNISFDSALLEYAASRRKVSAESPSLNPSGAFLNLITHQSLGKRELVLITEVLGNGMAKISEVVKPPKNREILEKLEEALEQPPNAFLPASLDNRSDKVKVVLKIRRIEIVESKGKAVKKRN